MRDKAIAEISGILFPHAQEIILTAPRQARALAPAAMREFADHAGVRVAPDIEAALALVRDATAPDVVFVTGSLFLVAEARALLLAKRES
jgi:folylpolyglutamate synthase/dihydropteroate synthase